MIYTSTLSNFLGKDRIRSFTKERVAISLLLVSFISIGSAPLVGAEISLQAEALGFSAERLTNIDRRMDEAVQAGVMSGGQGLILKNGEPIYRGSWGYADRELRTPLTDDTRFRIYSMTKPITSVALLMLYEEGLFLLEDPIADYLPELADLKLAQLSPDGTASLVEPTKQPSIRDLLRHTAGFSYGIFSDTPVDQQYRQSQLLQAATLQEFTERLGKLPLLLEPGSRWHYSVAVDVQGRLIEVVAGKPFSEVLQERIFAPLKMSSTSFRLNEREARDLAQLYSPIGTNLDWNSTWEYSNEQGLEVAAAELTAPYLDGSLFESGGAGLVSTLSDYAKFAQLLANQGEFEGKRLLSPHTVALMRSDNLDGANSDGLWSMDAFGLGVGVVTDPAKKSGELGGVGAYGWGGAAGTNFWVDPSNDLIGIFMVQSIPHQTSLAKKFRVLTYSALITPPVSPPASQPGS
ncbi:MAG: serine hydrolase domain-containing protein [Pseudomonadota bacterium]